MNPLRNIINGAAGSFKERMGPATDHFNKIPALTGDEVRDVCCRGVSFEPMNLFEVSLFTNYSTVTTLLNINTVLDLFGCGVTNTCTRKKWRRENK